LFERDEQAGFSEFRPGEQKLERERGFAASWSAVDKRGSSERQTAV
jgi:hypothetical protein